MRVRIWSDLHRATVPLGRAASSAPTSGRAATARPLALTPTAVIAAGEIYASVGGARYR
jgi:hypothetical protein